MHSIRNEHGAVIVFVTLMIVLLLIMVGMGLDTGHLSYIRSQGQAAVDAAALAAASAIPTGDPTKVNDRVARFNSKNDYVSGGAGNTLDSPNITYVQYDSSTGNITAPVAIGAANGVRVALESSNPYSGTASDTAMTSPLFLTPLFNLFGQSVKTTADVSVSAVAVIRAVPGLPVAIQQSMCGGGPPFTTQIQQKLLQSSSTQDNSGYTTYWIDNASKTITADMITNNYTCDSIPPVNIGFCTQLNNGQIYSLYDQFEDFFRPNLGQCYLIPVVKDGQSWNQCSPILDFAKFCPLGPSGTGKTKSADGKGYDRYLYGDLTCGESPYTTTATKCYVPQLVRDKKSGM